jgi:hypothetical protein
MRSKKPKLLFILTNTLVSFGTLFTSTWDESLIVNSHAAINGKQTGHNSQPDK